jgi:hypothetical protein
VVDLAVFVATAFVLAFATPDVVAGLFVPALADLDAGLFVPAFGAPDRVAGFAEPAFVVPAFVVLAFVVLAFTAPDAGFFAPAFAVPAFTAPDDGLFAPAFAGTGFDPALMALAALAAFIVDTLPLAVPALVGAAFFCGAPFLGEPAFLTAMLDPFTKALVVRENGQETTGHVA